MEMIGDLVAGPRGCAETNFSCTRWSASSEPASPRATQRHDSRFRHNEPRKEQQEHQEEPAPERPPPGRRRLADGLRYDRPRRRELAFRLDGG